MPQSINSLTDALAVLKPNVIAHLELYRVNAKDEAETLPQALWTNPDELRALRFVIDALPAALKLLKGGVEYVEVSEALKGKLTNADEAEAAWAEQRERLGCMSVGRTAVPLATFDLAAARTLTGQRGTKCRVTLPDGRTILPE